MKLMYAVWGPDLGRTLHGAGLRADLAAAGASRLQVNLDDAAVADAQLRITAFDEPVPAVVSVWTEADADPVSAVVSALAGRALGWEVEETVRLVPPTAADGERTDALAQIGFLRIPADLDEAEWLHRWQGQHTQVAIDTQASFGYVQNRVLRSVLGESDVAALVEELFVNEAATDMHAWYGSGGDDAELQRRLGLMIESVTRFGAHTDLDSVPTSRYTWALSSA